MEAYGLAIAVGAMIVAPFLVIPVLERLEERDNRRRGRRKKSRIRLGQRRR